MGLLGSVPANFLVKVQVQPDKDSKTGEENTEFMAVANPFPVQGPDPPIALPTLPCFVHHPPILPPQMTGVSNYLLQCTLLLALVLFATFLQSSLSFALLQHTLSYFATVYKHVHEMEHYSGIQSVSDCTGDYFESCYISDFNPTYWIKNSV